MDDFIVWIIIIAFYAPLHFLLPIMVLFITGQESDSVRRRLMRNSLIDSVISMVLAFVVVIALTRFGHILPAMVILLLSMGFPFIRIWTHRREIRRPVSEDRETAVGN